MIIKDYFTDGLLQIAIVLSLLRSDLDGILDTSHSRHPVGNQLSESNMGPLSGITRTDLNFHSRQFVRELPKVIDDGFGDRMSSVLRDIHMLSYYRRFDGISTSVAAWLVDGGGATESDELDNATNSANSSDIASGSSQAVDSPAVDLEEASFFGHEPGGLDLLEGELSKEDMELINILYLQDIDLGIARDVFDDLNAETDFVDSKQFDTNPAVCSEDEWGCPNAANASDALHSPVDGGPSIVPGTSSEDEVSPLLDLGGDYVVDTETGELIPASDPLTVPGFLGSSSSNQPPVVTPDLSVEYGRQSSYECRWSDMWSLLDLETAVDPADSTRTSSPVLVETDWPTGYDELSLVGQYSGLPSDGLLQNVSMAALVVPAADDLMQMSSDVAMLQLSPDLMTSSRAAMSRNLQSSTTVETLGLSPVDDFPMEDLCFDVDHTIPAGMMNLTCQQPSPVADITTPTASNDTNYDFLDDVFGVNASSAARGMYGFLDRSATSPTMPFSDYPSPPVTTDFLGEADRMQFAAEGESLSPAENSTVRDTNELFQLLRTNLLLSELDSGSYADNLAGAVSYDATWSSGDSAVSSMHSPTVESAMDTLAGDSPPHGGSGGAASGSSEYCYYTDYGSAAGSTGSRRSLTNASRNGSASADERKQVGHNHTYSGGVGPGPSGRTPRAGGEESGDREVERDDAGRCRDQRKAKNMQIPLSMEEMIDSSVDEFNDLLSRRQLSEAQGQLVRDIRRRGKNKLAAQNCRKRKMEMIQSVEDELMELRRERDQLLHDKSTLGKRTASLKQKYSELEGQLFQRLRDENGQEFDPRAFSVLQTDDGRVFVVPRSSTDQARDERNKRKRKPDKRD